MKSYNKTSNRTPRCSSCSALCAELYCSACLRSYPSLRHLLPSLQPRSKVTPSRFASLSRVGIERVTGISMAAPISDELENVGPRELLVKVRVNSWGRRS